MGPLNIKSTCGTEPLVDEAEINSRSDWPNIRRKWLGGTGEGNSEARAKQQVLVGVFLLPLPSFAIDLVRLRVGFHHGGCGDFLQVDALKLTAYLGGKFAILVRLHDGESQERIPDLLGGHPAESGAGEVIGLPGQEFF